MKPLALAFLLFASTPIIIDTSKLPPGRTVINTSGSRTVAAFREGNTVTVTVKEGKREDTVRITREGASLSIAKSNNGEERQLIVPDRQPVIVDGMDLEPILAGAAATYHEGPFAVPPDRRDAYPRPRYFLCPKDETMVRVKPGRAAGDLMCPLDGTKMEESVGHDKQYWLLH